VYVPVPPLVDAETEIASPTPTVLYAAVNVPADNAEFTVTVTELGDAAADPPSVSVTVSDTVTVP
jgi:hypothetical protein